jgi:predicted ATPase
MDVRCRSAHVPSFVSKNELVAHAWPGAIVQENTLRVHIHAIRKALGPDRTLLKTSSSRGYRLLGLWTTGQPDGDKDNSAPLSSARKVSRLARGNLPAAISELIGRNAALQELKDLVSAYRVVTLTGPGGIGKTTLALELGRTLAADFDGAAFVAELASIVDASLVSSAVAQALGLNLAASDITSEELVRAIGTARLFLVLDNCEHVIEAAAEVAEAIVRGCPHVSLVATSREFLRSEGERVYRVPALEVPDPGEKDVDQLAGCGAVALFLARTRAFDDRFSLHPANMSAVAGICRRLEGIPLAIEFAASRAATLGVQEVTAALKDHFDLLTSGRRTSLPRHRTLRATLDWSYELLSDSERRLLRCAAIFVGPFSLDDAAAVARSDDAVETLSNLVGKSLVVAEAKGKLTLYRLLETTRLYALDKLNAADEREATSRRHAEHYRDLLERLEPEWERPPTDDWRAGHSWRIDNVRAALDWAFAEKGNMSTAVALSAAAVPLWMHLSLLGECLNRAEQALRALSRMGPADARREMKLQIATANILGFGRDLAGAKAAWERGLFLARSVGDVDYQLRALWAAWYSDFRQPPEQFAEIAATPRDKLTAERMMGVSHHLRGDQREARACFERLLANENLRELGPSDSRFLGDLQAAALTSLARILWLQGYPDQATQTAARAVARAKSISHAFSLGHALTLAGCRIALWTGNLQLAQDYVDSTNDTQQPWDLSILCSRGVLMIERGDVADGTDVLLAGFAKSRTAGVSYRLLRLLDYMGELASGLGRSDRVAEGIDTIVEAIARADDTDQGWVRPELMRIKGELLWRQNAPETKPGPEACFREALDEAGRQGALAWELRAATSLARLLHEQNRTVEAAAVLQPIYDRFTEGLDTADLASARELLDSLR